MTFEETAQLWDRVFLSKVFFAHRMWSFDRACYGFCVAWPHGGCTIPGTMVGGWVSHSPGWSCWPGGVTGYPLVLVPFSRSIAWVRVTPSASSYEFVGTFSCAQMDSRKTRERESATFGENRRAVGMLNPMRYKNGRHVPGGRKDDNTCDHSLSRVQKLESNVNSETKKRYKGPTVNSTILVWIQVYY